MLQDQAHHARVANVERHQVRLGPVRLAQLGGERLEPIGAARGQQETRAGGREGARARRADAGRGAGDEDDPGESRHWPDGLRSMER
jgi:hypothetical protein